MWGCQRRKTTVKGSQLLFCVAQLSKWKTWGPQPPCGQQRLGLWGEGGFCLVIRNEPSTPSLGYFIICTFNEFDRKMLAALTEAEEWPVRTTTAEWMEMRLCLKKAANPFGPWDGNSYRVLCPGSMLGLHFQTQGKTNLGCFTQPQIAFSKDGL